MLCNDRTKEPQSVIPWIRQCTGAGLPRLWLFECPAGNGFRGTVGNCNIGRPVLAVYVCEWVMNGAITDMIWRVNELRLTSAFPVCCHDGKRCQLTDVVVSAVQEEDSKKKSRSQEQKQVQD